MEAEAIKRKRRWYQFSLRTLMIVAVPYAATYAFVVSAIVSDRGPAKHAATGWKFIEELRGAIGDAMEESMTRNMLISFTVAWIVLPIAGWAIWRSVSRVYRRLHGPPTRP